MLALACAVLGALSGAFAPATARRFAWPAATSGTASRPWPAVGWAVLGAASFGVLGWAMGPSPLLLAALPVAVAGMLLAATDLACLRLPDPLVGAAFLGTVAVLGSTAVAQRDGYPLLCGGLAGLGTALGYGLAALVPRTGLGLGDAKLAGVLGVLLGAAGWPAVLLGLVLPYLVNGPVVVALLLARRVRRDTPLPFGPALLAGGFLALVLAG